MDFLKKLTPLDWGIAAGLALLLFRKKGGSGGNGAKTVTMENLPTDFYQRAINSDLTFIYIESGSPDSMTIDNIVQAMQKILSEHNLKNVNFWFADYNLGQSPVHPAWNFSHTTTGDFIIVSGNFVMNATPTIPDTDDLTYLNIKTVLAANGK